MGALLAGAPGKSMDAIYRYGELLGLAFQLQDDYLDTYGDPALFGKEIGGDIINEKKTWLWITAMSERPEEIKGILSKKLTDYLKIKEIKSVYDDLNLAERSHKMIEQYAAEAIAALDCAGMPHEGQIFFENLASGLISRSN